MSHPQCSQSGSQGAGCPGSITSSRDEFPSVEIGSQAGGFPLFLTTLAPPNAQGATLASVVGPRSELLLLSSQA